MTAVENPGFYKKTIFFLFVGFILGILFFVSLLGENNKANEVVSNFFKHIRAHEYERVLFDISPGARFYDDAGIPFQDFVFLFELSMVSRFELWEEDDYQVSVKRTFFWIPYVSDNRMEMTIALRKKGGGLAQNLFGATDNTGLTGLMVLERIDGRWQIVDININHPEIAAFFEQARKKLTTGGLYAKTENGFVMDRFEYDTQNTAPVDKYLFRYVMWKAQEMMDGSL